MVVQLWTDQTQRVDPGIGAGLGAGHPDGGVVQAVRARTATSCSSRTSRDRDAADSLRGLELEAEPLDDVPDVLWVHELVGATVRDAAGTALGTVASVEANPASDLMVLESGGLIPVRFVTAHDAAARTVDVDIPEGLLDL